MRNFMTRFLAVVITILGLCAIWNAAAFAEQKKSFKIVWSIYAGWMPWGYIADHGIMKKWADKYGIDVKIIQLNDYVESINQYSTLR